MISENNGTTIKYSIVIPHYNSPKELQRLFTTIPDRSDIQVIVVDDNSTKDIGELQQYRKRFARYEFYINDTAEKGAGACRNIGIKYAKGKWVFLVDADDYLTENFLSQIERFYDSDYEVVYFVPVSIDIYTGQEAARHITHKKVIEKYHWQPSHQNELELRYQWCTPCSKMIRRDYLLYHQIDFEAVEVSNDVMFSTKLAYYMTSFATALEPIYCITRSEGTLTTKRSIERFKIRREVFIRQCLFLREHLPETDWRKLRLSGEQYLIASFLQGGARTFSETLKIFRQNKIKLFSFKTFMLFYSPRKLILKWKRARYLKRKMG